MVRSRFVLLLSMFLFIISPVQAGGKNASKPVAYSTLHQTISRNIKSINPKALEVGIKAYQCANRLAKKKYLTIIDYTKPSTQKRLYIIDMKKHALVSQQYVAHGQNSGGKRATKFSNRNGSHQSSIGVFVTGQTYQGKNGLSLRLNGLDRGYNDQANRRLIVIHGASYVSPNYARKGMLGRSWGCPALEPKHARSTINKLKNGSVVVAYYKDQSWMKHSRYLHCSAGTKLT